VQDTATRIGQHTARDQEFTADPAVPDELSEPQARSRRPASCRQHLAAFQCFLDPEAGDRACGGQRGSTSTSRGHSSRPGRNIRADGRALPETDPRIPDPPDSVRRTGPSRSSRQVARATTARWQRIRKRWWCIEATSSRASRNDGRDTSNRSSKSASVPNRSPSSRPPVMISPRSWSATCLGLPEPCQPCRQPTGTHRRFRRGADRAESLPPGTSVSTKSRVPGCR
jgi:hypothetical protein